MKSLVAVLLISSTVFACAILCPPALGQDDGGAPVALGAKVGTLGGQLDVTFRLTDVFNLRATGNYLNFSHSDEIDDVEYDLDMDFQALGLLLDIHPFANNFRLTGGVLQNSNEVLLEGQSSEPVTIGDTEYPGALLGTLVGTTEFSEISPYVGIGFGNAVAGSGGFSFVFDLGVLIQTYDVTLEATGPANLIPGFEEDLQQEADDIEDELNALNIYPVLAFGMAYQF